MLSRNLSDAHTRPTTPKFTIKPDNSFAAAPNKSLIRDTMLIKKYAYVYKHANMVVILTESTIWTVFA
jgi:hypothetical protein